MSIEWKKLLKISRTQIIFVCAAFALMVAIGSLYVSNVIRKASQATITVALNETEKTIQAYLREPRVAFYNIYTALQGMLDRGDSQEAVLEYLAHTTNLLTKENRISGFNSVYGYIRGEFISGLKVDLGDDYVPQKRPWFQLAIRNKTAEYTPPYTDENTKQTIISLAQEIYGRNGAYYGVLSMDIDISWLVEYTKTLQFAEGGYGIIANQYLFVIVHPQDRYKNMLLENIGGDYAKVSKELRAGKPVSGLWIRDFDNTNAIVFFKELYNGWLVGVVMPVKSYFSDLYWCIVILSALGIVFALILNYSLIRLSAAKLQSEEESRYKSSFMARISHEIRTPINAIIGMTEIVLRERLPEAIHEQILTIKKAGANLLSIVNDLLNVSKLGSVNLKIDYENTGSMIIFNAPKARVLVVDDIETNLKVADGLMRPYKMQVELRKSGIAAIESVKKNSYDLIFMDHMMPEMDGVEATKRIRELGFDLPIIALTANTVAGAREMFLESGFNDFLSKPIIIDKLNAILEKWIPKEKQEKASEGSSEAITAIAEAELLAIFYKDGFSKIEILNKCLEVQDYNLYTIHVHALKSASANVGAANISESAKALEDAGKRGDFEFIKLHNAQLLTDLQIFLDSISSVVGEKRAELPGMEALLKLKKALKDLDMDAIDEIANDLQDFAQAEGILQNILLGEYDKALALTENLLYLNKKGENI